MLPLKNTIFVLLLTLFSLLSACSEETIGTNVVGYNHTKDRTISIFTVNDSMGSNLMPESGGGAFTCCIDLPKTWRPGLKAKIKWKYSDGDALPPPPPDQEIELDIPKYEHVSDFNVHFFDNHQVKIVITGMSIDHPDYPKELKW